MVTTERFLPTERVKPKQLKALREHVRDELRSAPVAARRARPARGHRRHGPQPRRRWRCSQEELPSLGVQGFCIHRAALDELVERLAELTPRSAARVPGIKPERADLILAGAVVVQTVMEVGGFDALEVTEAGLREGVFFEELLAGSRRAAGPRRARRLGPQPRRPVPPRGGAHRARRAARAGDLGRAARRGPAPGDAATSASCCGPPAILHDVGTAVDYDDHHKHSRYLILNAGLPGFSPRETALIGQAARYHRKGQPGLREFAPLGRKGDEELLARCAAAAADRRAARAPARPDRPPRAMVDVRRTTGSSCG